MTREKMSPERLARMKYALELKREGWTTAQRSTLYRVIDALDAAYADMAALRVDLRNAQAEVDGAARVVAAFREALDALEAHGCGECNPRDDARLNAGYRALRAFGWKPEEER